MSTKNKTFAFATLGLLLALLLGLIRWDGQILQYLFYLRVPLLGGALLFLLPVLCIFLLPSMLGNLFVLSNIWRMALIIPGAVATGLGIVLVGGIIGANAPARFDLVSCPWLSALGAESAISPYIMALVLALPTALATYWSSGPASGEMTDTDRNRGALLGTILSALLLGVVYLLRSDVSVSWASNLLLTIVSILPGEARKGLVMENGALAPGHLTA